jgi:hypothetical protein
VRVSGNGDLMGGIAGATAAGHGDGAVLFAIVVLAGEVPEAAVLIFPTAGSADRWASGAGLAGYQVVSARFVNVRAPAVL